MAAALLRREKVMELLGVRRTTLLKMLADGELPPPVKVTGNIIAWPDDEIQAFIDRRIAASRGTNTKEA